MSKLCVSVHLVLISFRDMSYVIDIYIHIYIYMVCVRKKLNSFNRLWTGMRCSPIWMCMAYFLSKILLVFWVHTYLSSFFSEGNFHYNSLVFKQPFRIARRVKNHIIDWKNVPVRNIIPYATVLETCCVLLFNIEIEHTSQPKSKYHFLTL